MEETVVKEEVINESKPEYNQKPRMLARILSALVDMFMIFLCGFLIFQIELAAPISNDYHRLRDELITIIDQTKLDTSYGHKLYEDEDNYSSYTSYRIYKEEDESLEQYGKNYVVIDNLELTSEVKNAYQASLKDNATYQDRYITYRAIYFGLLMLAVGSAEVVLVLIIPLTNKRRATLGRFAAITSLISNKEVKAKWWQVLIRFFFVLLIETALPLFYLSELATILVVVLVNLLIMLISRKTGRTLRDYVSLTRIIDKNSFKPINEQ